MPITPEYNEYVLNTLKVHKELQESILRDIVRRMLKTDMTVTDTASWQAEKLQQSGMLYNDIIDEVAKRTDSVYYDILTAFNDAETEVFNYDNKLLTEAGFEPDKFKTLSPAMQSIWTAALAKTTTEAINLTKTTALTAQNMYIEACDLAHMQVLSGAFSYTEAISNGIRSAAKQGVTVSYPSGHKSSLDVAIRRSVLTGVNQTAAKLQEMRVDEFGVDLVEVSAHYGARPDHAEWQGQVYSRSGETKGYDKFEDATGYGTLEGLCGVNCRHNFYPFFEGISKRSYTDKQLEDMKNHTVEYNGKQLTDYDAKQLQRRFERNIRTTKQELVMYDEAKKNVTTDEEKALWQQEFNNSAVKLKGQEAKLKDFCKQTGFYVDNNRTQVFAVATENGIKNFGKSVSQKAVQSAQTHYDVWKKSIGADDLPKTLAKYYNMKYNKDDEYRLFERYKTNVEKGTISPLSLFSNFKTLISRINTEIVGITTKDGIKITGQSKHFIERVLGTMKEPKTLKKREGVDLEEIKEALTNPGKIYTVKFDEDGNPSIKYEIFGKCDVTVNPNTGTLIQTNPKK